MKRPTAKERELVLLAQIEKLGFEVQSLSVQLKQGTSLKVAVAEAKIVTLEAELGMKDRAERQHVDRIAVLEQQLRVKHSDVCALAECVRTLSFLVPHAHD